MKNKNNSKSGFTIIEVVLVLAIAGLIFLMVFIALPALQRSQRDTQRRDDLAMLATALNSYSTNNRGKVPLDAAGWAGFWTTYLKSNAYSEDGTSVKASDKITHNQPGTFSNGSTNVDTEFVDPLGYNYVFYIDSNRGSTWNWNSTAVTDNGTTSATSGFTIHIYASSHCSGETVETDNSNRVIAYKYRLEGSGYYCGDNA